MTGHRTRLQHNQLTGLTLGGSELQNTEHRQNLCVVLDGGLTIKLQVSITIKSPFFHLSNIAIIKHIIPTEDPRKIIHLYVLWHLDYCNAIGI